MSIATQTQGGGSDQVVLGFAGAGAHSKKSMKLLVFLWPTQLPDQPGIYSCTGTTRYQCRLSDGNTEVVDHALHEGTFQLVSPKVQVLNKAIR